MLRISNRLISSGVRKAMANTNSATATSRSFHRNIACVNLHLKSELRSSLAPFSARNRFNAIRTLSSNTNKDDPASKKHPDQENRNEHELVLTPGQKVVAGTRLTLWASAFVFGSFCLYYIVKELLPTKLSPNSIFSKATDVVTNSAEVKRRFGEPLKCYGRDHGGHREGRRNFIEHTEYKDHGGHREGRRNFIEHTEYKDKDDGSTRVRVRFNLEGKYGAAFVFCEVSSQMDSGEFVYLLVQDKRNGMVITLVDNRSRLLAERMGGGSQAGRQAFGNLLGGGVGQQK